MALNVATQQLLRAALDKTTDKFFRARQKFVVTDGPPQIDATGILVVLSEWAGDLIRNAPEDMRDNLFMAFADNVITIAGIKEPAETEAETVQ